MAVDEGLDAALDHAQRRAELMGDVRDELGADRFQVLLPGDVVQDEQRPRARAGIERRDDGAGDLQPDRPLAVDELDLALGARPARPDVRHEIEECDAVKDPLQPLVENVARRGEDRLERAVGQEDSVLRVDDEDGLLKAAEGGFEMGELPGAEPLQRCQLREQLAGRLAKRGPVGSCAGPGRNRRCPALYRPREFAERPAVRKDDPERNGQGEAERSRDQVEHASALRSEIR